MALKGWNERVADSLESIAESLVALRAALSEDGQRLRTLSPAESATTTTTAAPTTTTTAAPTTTTTAAPTTTTTAVT